MRSRRLVGAPRTRVIGGAGPTIGANIPAVQQLRVRPSMVFADTDRDRIRRHHLPKGRNSILEVKRNLATVFEASEKCYKHDIRKLPDQDGPGT